MQNKQKAFLVWGLFEFFNCDFSYNLHILYLEICNGFFSRKAFCYRYFEQLMRVLKEFHRVIFQVHKGND